MPRVKQVPNPIEGLEDEANWMLQDQASLDAEEQKKKSSFWKNFCLMKRVMFCQGCYSVHLKQELTLKEEKEFKATGKVPHFGPVFKLTDDYKVVEDYYVRQEPTNVPLNVYKFLEVTAQSEVGRSQSSIWAEEQIPALLARQARKQAQDMSELKARRDNVI